MRNELLCVFAVVIAFCVGLELGPVRARRLARARAPRALAGVGGAESMTTTDTLYRSGDMKITGGAATSDDLKVDPTPEVSAKWIIIKQAPKYREIHFDPAKVFDENGDIRYWAIYERGVNDALCEIAKYRAVSNEVMAGVVREKLGVSKPAETDTKPQKKAPGTR